MTRIISPLSSSLSSNFVPLIIFNGESNSGGYALNSDLTLAQLLPRPSVQIYNNATLIFETLQIGVNNLIDHTGLSNNATHGWENGLATAVEAGLFTGFTQVYLVKTGQGGSNIAQWSIGNGTGYLSTYIARIQAAKALILASGKIPLPFIWYTQGINDKIAGTDPTTWKANTIAHFKNLRQYIGYAPIIEPLFMTGQGSYNTYLSDIQVTEKYFFTVSSTDATLRDANHWSAQGMALLASRMANLTINTVGLGFENYTLTSLLAIGGSPPTTDVTSPLSAPAFTVQPSNQSASEGGTATFTYTVIGYPIPTIQAQKQEGGVGAFNDVSGATSTSYTTGVLTVSADNGDVFRFVATNSQGSVTSNTVTLYVSPVSSLIPVNWISLSVGVTNGIPSAGFIASPTRNTGGRSDRAIDSTQAFAIVYDLIDNTSDTNVVYLSSNSTQDYSWGGITTTYIGGSYAVSGTIYRTLQSGTNTTIDTGVSYPAKVKIEKSGNDLIYSKSTDGGASYTVLNTQVGALVGQSTIYLKTLLAVGNTKIKVSQS